MERVLTSIAKAGGADQLTTALGKWTASLWSSPSSVSSPCFYIDGHRKPVYADKLIPRGLIGNTGKVLGARALILLHDEQGHPLLVTTHRGDQHLTAGVPPILARYQASGAVVDQSRLIVDREGMAAGFLRDLMLAGYTVVTVLKTDQYTGIESFSEVGTFVPLTYDRDGQVVREVAPACFALPLPESSGQTLPLRVALIRDWRRHIMTPEEEEAQEERNAHKRGWWRDGRIAEPTPAPPTQAKLIPIVTTTPACEDAIELATTYTRRWAAQENIIRDFLLPLGLNTNHGYGKTEVENSEVSKKRVALSKRLSNIQRWTVSAQTRARHASKLYTRLCKQTKQHGEQLYRALNKRVWELEAEATMSSSQLRAESKSLQAQAEAELAPLWQRVYQVLDKSNKEYAKCERYAHEQCDILRALEDLEKSERVMYEVDNQKDQVMSGGLARACQFGHVGAQSLFSCKLCTCHLEATRSLFPACWQSRLASTCCFRGTASVQRPSVQSGSARSLPPGQSSSASFARWSIACGDGESRFSSHSRWAATQNCLTPCLWALNEFCD